jgi:hypothetical protein
MSERLEELMIELNKSRAEFDVATTCVAQALQSVCQRLHEVELWIEDQKNPMPS